MVDEIVIRFSVNDDGSPKIERLNQTLKKTGETSKGIAPGLESASKGIASFTSQNAALIGVLVGVGAAAAKAFGDFQKYADTIRNISIATGSGAEDVSRMIQVLGDFGVTAEDITNAGRTMKDQGLVPTIEALARLSDQFLAIQDPAERLKFAQDNLGRSAGAYYNVLNQGSKVILANASAVNKNLILTDKQIRQAEQERLAVGALSSAWQGFWVQLGSGVGNLILVNDEFNKAIQILRDNGVAINANTTRTQEFKDALAQVRAEQESTSDAIAEGTGSTLAAAEAEKARQEALERLSQAFVGLLSGMFAVQSANDSYKQTIEDLNKSDEDLARKKFDLTLAFEREQRAGKDTTDSYNDYIRKLAEINQAIDENVMKRAEASKDLEKESAQRIYDLTQQRLAADGVIDSGEFEFLQNLAVQKGLVSQAAADQAIAESRAADDIVRSFGETGEAMSETLSLMQDIRANGGMVPFGVNFQNSGSLGGTPAPSPYNPSPHASGGQFMIPMGYGNEGFSMGGRDTASGGEIVTITPRGETPGGINNTFNITIGSIRSQADLDYLAQEITLRQTAVR